MFSLSYIALKVKSSKYLLSTFTFSILCYLIYLFLYQNTYIDTWTYGIAGSDMLSYYKAAESWFLFNIPPNLSFSNLSFSGVFSNDFGYYIYIFLLKYLLFYPNLGYFNVLLLKVLNFLIIYIAVLKIYFSTNKNIYIYTLLITNLSFYFVSARILRDSLIFYLMANTYSYALSNSRRSNLYYSINTFFLFLFRNYTLLITIPLFLYKKKKTNLWYAFYIIFFLVVAIISIFNVTIFQNILNLETDQLLFSSLQFLLSPDIIDSFIKLIDSFNISTFTYFGLSCWLTYVFIFTFASLLKRPKSDFYFLNLFSLLSIALLYGLMYEGANEPRHKLMMLIPLVFLANEGRILLKNREKFFNILLITFIVILLFILSIL